MVSTLGVNIVMMEEMINAEAATKQQIEELVINTATSQGRVQDQL